MWFRGNVRKTAPDGPKKLSSSYIKWNKKSQNGEGEKCSCGEKLNIVDLISKSKLPGPDCHQDGLSLVIGRMQ